MLTTSPKRIVHYVPREIREQGLDRPYFRIRTPTGAQKSKWLDHMRGDEDVGMAPEAGSFMNAAVKDCLVGWVGLVYDDPSDMESFGRDVPFDQTQKLDPLSAPLIQELFQFIMNGCRLKEDDVVPLQSRSSSEPESTPSPSTDSPAPTTPSSETASGATAAPSSATPSPAPARDGATASAAEGASPSSSSAARPTT